MLTVIAGGMFAEKSTELQRRGKRLIRAGKKVGYFKPDYDNRYSEDEIVTHDGVSIEANNIPSTDPAYFLSPQNLEYDVILIDEVQFFANEIVTIVEILLKRDKTVIVAGLDLDFQANPFGQTAYLMAIAEEVVKLKAVCSQCGDDSWVSYKEPNGQRLQLGTDEYKPMCRKCFEYTKHKEEQENE